ncbi:MAG: PspA/IM30 family protein [Candidatus Latescibacterota bacterium]|nr:PspA/IM30 family protein [Candidatus Latescibacterota bacterium]
MMIKTLDRISHILRSNVNEVLDRLEDPEKMVRQMVRDMEAAVDRAVGAVSTAVADQRRLAKEKAATRERIENMHAKATRVLERGDEALARQALARKVVLEETLAGIEPALNQGQQTVEDLRAKLSMLRDDLRDAQNRQGALIARLRNARRADEQHADVIGEHDPVKDVQNLERRLQEKRSEFDRLRQRLDLADETDAATQEVCRDIFGDGGLGHAFEQLAIRKRVDAELAALRGEKPEEATPEAPKTEKTDAN